MAIDRHNRLLIGLVVVALILLVRLFIIQITDEKYKINADNNSIVYTTIYPARGILYDRNGKILVGNKVSYDLVVTPREVSAFDTLALSEALDVPVSFIRERMDSYRAARRRIGYQSVVMLKQLPPETYTKFAEIAYKFPGFRGQERSIRDYPFNAGGNLVGYVTEVDKNYIDRHSGYSSGDYAGMTGLEAVREDDLKGEKGYEVYLRDARNKIEGRYRDGEADKPAVPGRDIVTTIDAELQKYGQELMAHKAGSIVALEPATGEILALVSSPGIDVEILAEIGKHFDEIAHDKNNPMFNRSVQGSYPPGSVFKLVNGLIGMQEGVLFPTTKYPCRQGYYFPGGKLGCHNHRSPIDLEESVMMSCNAYYCYVLKSIIENKKYGSVQAAFDKWNEYVGSFGFGTELGSDFPSEKSGTIPTSALYDRVYNKSWKANTVISLSIGQGEIGCTPLHLANLAAIMANRGWYRIPHIIKNSEKVTIDPKYSEKHFTLIDTAYFPVFVNGMYRAVNSGWGSGGTATIAAVPGLDICGKTGTAQNPQGADNSVFICFAPKDDPQIAVAVYVEHGGWG
ncbi:MAG: penicillin-binding protein 2, partial [Bacteroidales bacterium]|nr:penicillin-binding protein 2 [Bacteroidales bacterium]